MLLVIGELSHPDPSSPRFWFYAAALAWWAVTVARMWRRTPAAERRRRAGRAGRA